MASKKPKQATPKSTAERVSTYRDRVAAEGGRTIYGNIGKDANTALATIMQKKDFSIVGAIEYALLRCAKDVTRQR